MWINWVFFWSVTILVNWVHTCTTILVTQTWVYAFWHIVSLLLLKAYLLWIHIANQSGVSILVNRQEIRGLKS